MSGPSSVRCGALGLFGGVEGANDVAFGASPHSDWVKEATRVGVVAKSSACVDFLLGNRSGSNNLRARNVLARSRAVRAPVSIDSPGKAIICGRGEVCSVSFVKGICCS